jgi:hypothetical protein
MGAWGVVAWVGSRVPSLAVVTVASVLQVVVPFGRRSRMSVSPAMPVVFACWRRPDNWTVPPWRTLVGLAARVRVVAAGGPGVTGEDGAEGGLGPSGLVAATVKV